MTKFSRNSYTFREGLTMMAAKALGIDPDLAVEAGESATAVMNLIRHAAKLRNKDAMPRCEMPNVNFGLSAPVSILN